MHAWIVALILSCCPQAPRATLDEVADAIDIAAHEVPLYSTDDGVERTVAELVAVASFESRFDPNAIAEDWAGFSYGLFQIHETNFARFHIGPKRARNPLDSARVALLLLRESHNLCGYLPLEDRLSEYASGRGLCSTREGLEDSRRKMAVVKRLLSLKIPRWIDLSPWDSSVIVCGRNENEHGSKHD